jgi:hypothetical protein
MRNGTPPGLEGTELLSMAATLCSYESWLGPYHPQTLCLLTELAVAYGRHGDFAGACRFLERAIRDVGRYLGRDHEFRLRALVSLRDLSVEQRDYERAGTAQKELFQCQVDKLGADHPETINARDELARIILQTASSEA